MAMSGKSLLVCVTLMILAVCGLNTQDYQQACQSTAYPQACIESLSGFGLEGKNVASGTSGRFLLATSAMKAALDSVTEELKISQGGLLGGGHFVKSKRDDQAFVDCVELLTDACEVIGTCLSDTSANNTSSNWLSYAAVSDIHTLLSGALTYHSTCLDGLSRKKQMDPNMTVQAGKVYKVFSSALSFVASLYPSPHKASSHWIPGKDKQYLLFGPTKAVTSNVVVAKDGSGHYSSISQAVAAAPSGSRSTYVIYIKQGTYKEKVNIPKSKTNIMFVGDGIGKTIISGSKNVQDGSTTFRSATVEVNGKGFLGRDLTIENTAGAAKHQAVALRVSADKAGFYKCSFEGYQDTLYTHVFRQFYRECNIYGTVDFIFGNSAAMFQSCNILARVPMAKQKNTFTAQGREDRNQNTGLVFQECTFDGTSDLKSSSVRSFLGRPWKKYSRTLLLNCYESSVVDPAGWLEWVGSFALSTLYYAEYSCTGPGSGTRSRVSWSSQITSSSEADKYSAGNFIAGNDWLGGTGFPYKLGLSS